MTYGLVSPVTTASSTTTFVAFAIDGRDEPVTVYTTRPDTLFGATFFVVAADSDLAAELAEGSPAQIKRDPKVITAYLGAAEPDAATPSPAAPAGAP